MAEFIKWESTARLFRDVVITEKLDGTNACVIFERVLIGESDPKNAIRLFDHEDGHYAVFAQSRNRLITPSSDNAGFAKWVQANAEQIFYVLGEGRHYGEWWGQGIGRKYDMKEKVFSVFNTAAWSRMDEGIGSRHQRAYTSAINIDVVPILATCTFNEDRIRDVAEALRGNGSFATAKYTGEAFPSPEGLCIYHRAADRVFKYTFDGNDKHKWEEPVQLVTGKTRTLMDMILRRK